MSTTAKLSVYDPPAPTTAVVTIPPTDMELAVRSARHAVRDTLTAAGEATTAVAGRWVSLESSVAASVKSLYDPRDPTLNLLYPPLALFTASFVLRSRGLVARATLPPLAMAAAAAYFTPHTAHLAASTARNALPVDAQRSVDSAITDAAKQWRAVRMRAAEVQAKARELSAGVVAPSTQAKPLDQAELVKGLESMYSMRGPSGVREVVEREAAADAAAAEAASSTASESDSSDSPIA
ncbi:apolipo protein O-domain-containing protein [Blastocladiella britannica]|nr:apolipo protein O-domain-containing protein [Blastocladiella britannica]